MLPDFQKHIGRVTGRQPFIYAFPFSFFRPYSSSHLRSFECSHARRVFERICHSTRQHPNVFLSGVGPRAGVEGKCEIVRRRGLASPRSALSLSHAPFLGFLPFQPSNLPIFQPVYNFAPRQPQRRQRGRQHRQHRGVSSHHVPVQCHQLN